MKFLRVVTVILIFIGGVFKVKNIEYSDIILIIGILLGLYLGTKNLKKK